MAGVANHLPGRILYGLPNEGSRRPPLFPGRFRLSLSPHGKGELLGVFKRREREDTDNPNVRCQGYFCAGKNGLRSFEKIQTENPEIKS